MTLGEFTGRVWRHIHHDSDGTRFEFDVTFDGLVDASSSGVGSNPQRLRELASVALATADELGEARARRGTRQAVGGLPDGFTTMEPPPRGVGRGFCHDFVTRTSRGLFPTPPNPRPATRGALGVACRSGPTRPTYGSSGFGSSGLGRNIPTIACCASSIAFFWAVHCRSTKSVNAFRWCSICSLIALR